MSDEEIARLRAEIQVASRKLDALERQRAEAILSAPVPTADLQIAQPQPVICTNCNRRSAEVMAVQVQDKSKPTTGWLGFHPTKLEYRYKYPTLPHLRQTVGPFCEGCAKDSQRAEEERRKQQDLD